MPRGSSPFEPRNTLHAAYADHSAGRHSAALEKYIWYFRNAPKGDPVRGSFCIGMWAELAKTYIPARLGLVAERDRLFRALVDGPRDFDHFLLFQSINRSLRCDLDTVRLFEHLHETDSQFADACVSPATPLLIQFCRLDLIVPHLNLALELEFLAHAVAHCKEQYDSASRMPSLHADSLMHAQRNVATTVAVLVRAGCAEQGASHAAAATAICSDEQFQSLLGIATSGVIPDDPV